jgi:hypothetical protein
MPEAVERALGRCPYCHEDVLDAPGFVLCRGCLARHHAACWIEHGACASCREERCLSDPRSKYLDLGGTPLELVAALPGATRRQTERTLLVAGVASLAAVAALVGFAAWMGRNGPPFLIAAPFFVWLGWWLLRERRRWVAAPASVSASTPVARGERAPSKDVRERTS